MLRTNLPRAVRALRRRRGWRQVDLAERSGMSRQLVTKLEAGRLADVQLRSVIGVVGALGGSIDLTVRWEGERLDRVLDAAHAALVRDCVALLTALGWLTQVEVSFNHFGDRGRADVVAWHEPMRCLVIVEVKSVIADHQETLGRIDVKARLGAVLAENARFGPPRRIVPALVIADRRSARRLVATHDSLYSRFDLRGRRALAWLRRPTDPTPSGLLWFANLPDATGGGRTRDRRVRTVRSGG